MLKAGEFTLEHQVFHTNIKQKVSLLGKITENPEYIFAGFEFLTVNTIQNLFNKVRTTRMLIGVHNIIKYKGGGDSSSAGKFANVSSALNRKW